MTVQDVIRLLPDSVANQIAAGEVIQRPASVIKELVENAVDAGATRIDIIVKDAGRTLIQVVDNGCGMTDTDARMAFERHATSKIGEAADLFRLRTMGFRGEALPSIAAVARLEVHTMREGAPMGTRLLIEGSRVESQVPEAGTKGTNMMVKDLFFNVPVRRRFLKKDATEYAAMLREFERLALVNPGLDLSISHNGTCTHDLRRGTLLQRICALFGKDLNHKLIPVSADTADVKIDGFISLPEHSRRRSPLQFFFVNGRNMRHPYFNKAVQMCYSSLLPPDVQPGYFINFSVDPSTIDVNIHPTKNEIKFENEQLVWQILTSAVNESLGRYNAGPAIDFNAADNPDIPSLPAFGDGASAAAPSMPGTGTTAGYNPFRPSSRPPRDWATLYSGFQKERSQPASAPTLPDFPVEAAPAATAVERQGMLDLTFEPAAPTAIQLRNRYIVTPTSAGLLVIDQHRAHKLVLYHSCLERSQASAATASQKLMFAQTLDIRPSDDPHMATLASVAGRMGFELCHTAPGQWRLDAVPPTLSESVARDTVLGLLELVGDHDDSSEAAADELRRRVALSIAEAGAVKAGQPLRQEEIDRIAAALFALPAPAVTPDGQRVFVTIEFDRIAQCFG